VIGTCPLYRKKADITDLMSTRLSCTAAARAYQTSGDVAGTAQATIAKNVGLKTASIEIAASYDGQNVICALSASRAVVYPDGEADEPPSGTRRPLGGWAWFP
jgi:hypothetical protein